MHFLLLSLNSLVIKGKKVQEAYSLFTQIFHILRAETGSNTNSNTSNVQIECTYEVSTNRQGMDGHL